MTYWSVSGSRNWSVCRTFYGARNRRQIEHVQFCAGN